jgi:MFS family permease
MTGFPHAGCDLGIARAAVPTGSPEKLGLVLLASIAGSCLVFVSGAVVSVALAAIGRGLSLDAHILPWVLNAELLPLAALTLVGGALGDRYGQRRVFLLGIAAFALASVGCVLARDGLQLVSARFLLGASEALILPTGLTFLGQAFPLERRSWAIGVWSASAAVASAVAPAVAGLILDHASWREALFLQVPLAAVAFAIAARWAPESPCTPHAPIDLAAALLSVAGLGAFGWWLTALTNNSGAWPVWVIGAPTALAAFITLAFVEARKGDGAMLPPALFGSRTVVALSVFTALLYGAFTAILTFVPFVMIRGANLSALAAGVAFIPLQILITVISPLAPALCARLGHSLPLAIGAMIAAIGCVAALRIDVAAAYWSDVFPAVALVALGVSLVLAPMTTLVMTSVDSRFAATASGFNGAVSRAGSLVAIALSGGILQQSGTELIHGFHFAMVASTIACVLAACAALSIAPAPVPLGHP